ncbi:hypothetical protein EAE96_008260 [Botrytis aclada]|nr:hypothetical protein EAE96_008260 [Botrytis aclada]
MPPKGARKPYQRGEQVFQVGDPSNNAFKAQPVKNNRKRPNKAQPSIENGPIENGPIENGPIEIDSDNENSQPSKKPCPGPRASKLRVCATKQEKNVVESRSESEDDSYSEVVPCVNYPPRKLFKPFADDDADVYIVLVQKTPKYSFRMHSHILRRASPWFAGELQEDLVNELDVKLAATITQDTGIKYRFELVFDGHLGHHTLRRVGLTMYKQQPQAVANRAIPSFRNGYNGYSFSVNGSSNSRHSSVVLPQYDGPCDDIEMANTTGDPNVSTGFDISEFLSFPGPLPLTQDFIDEAQGEDGGIKLEKDTTTHLNSAEVNPPAQKDVAEQVATPPTSPIKAETGSETDRTIFQSPQVYTGSQAPLAEQGVSTAAPNIKAEIGSGEQTFSPSLLEHKSPERQLQVLSNAEDKDDDQCRTVLQPNEMPLSRQVSSEEQLQDAISTENPMELEKKPEEAQPAPTSPLKQQLRVNPCVEEPSIDHLIGQTVVPTTEKPLNNITGQKVATSKIGQAVLDAYHSLFLCYFGCAPTISTSDVTTAAKQSMLLIKIANLYGSANVVKTHIVASLFSHGRNLYSAIREDPPYFLLLAFKLQCNLIFKEALIHIVGQYPSWPWITKENLMGHTLGKVIQKKYDNLQDKRFKVNGPLFQSCIVKDKVRVSINNLDRSTFDIWVIVQIWHDWFSQQLRHCTLVQRHEHRNVEKNMYRLIAQGGDAYLKIDDVMAMIEPFRAGSETREWGHWEKDQVEFQLNILKEHAAKKVKDLLVNELMGDTGGNAGEIEYLTCTKVYEHELPWAEAQVVVIED